jgi:hypothetical protein
VWSSETDVPDREHIMESLEHGCLPLQFARTARVEGEEGLTESARALLVRADGSGSLRPLSDEELGSRLKVVAEALATGQLERDLSHRHG